MGRPVALVGCERWGRPLRLAALALAVLRLPTRGCCSPIPLQPITPRCCCFQGFTQGLYQGLYQGLSQGLYQGLSQGLR